MFRENAEKCGIFAPIQEIARNLQYCKTTIWLSYTYIEIKIEI